MKESLPQFSIIIPCYNQGEYLGEAIQSVQSQTRSDWEAIIVDDGSTDDTRQVANSIQDSRFHYIYQSNSGLAAARNSGLHVAQAEWIAFLDADDLWKPAFLEKLAQALVNQPKVGAVYCGWGYIDRSANPLPSIHLPYQAPEKMNSALVAGNFLNACGVLIKRECFERCGEFDETLVACEDWDLWLRVSSNYRMIGLKEPLVYYRMHDQNMTRDLMRMESARRVVVRRHFGEEDSNYKKWPEIKLCAYGGLYVSLALERIQAGNFSEAAFRLFKALSINPALANNLDVFYEIALADQPPGYRGVFKLIDLERNQGLVETILTAVFSQPGNDSKWRKHKFRSYSTAYYALGLLAYGAGNIVFARLWFWRSLSFNKIKLFSGRFMAAFCKTLLKFIKIKYLSRSLKSEDSAGF